LNAEESAENASELDNEDDEDDEVYAAYEVSYKQKRHLEINVYETVKRWVTGEMAELEPCDIQHQPELEARKLMNESGMEKLPNHKVTKKQACDVEEECITYNSYNIKHENYWCQMYHCCKCRAYIEAQLQVERDAIANNSILYSFSTQFHTDYC
jgi:hypothetical protein